MLALACTKSSEVKTDDTSQTVTVTDKKKEESLSKNENTKISVEKQIGQLETKTTDTSELFGWAPPPPGAPPDTKPQWLPIKKEVKETETKQAPTTVKTDVDKSASKTENQKTNTTGATTANDKKDTSKTEKEHIGFSLATKIWLVLGALVLVSVFVSIYVNPNLLAIPAKIFKSLLARFIKPPESKP